MEMTSRLRSSNRACSSAIASCCLWRTRRADSRFAMRLAEHGMQAALVAYV